jgi:hypothetical protein
VFLSPSIFRDDGFACLDRGNAPADMFGVVTNLYCASAVYYCGDSVCLFQVFAGTLFDEFFGIIHHKRVMVTEQH